MINRPRLVLTLGDPAGIGAEVILKTLADSRLMAAAHLTIAGNRQHFQQTYDRLSAHRSTHDFANLVLDSLNWLEVKTPGTIRLGIGDVASGEASFRTLETAIAHTLNGEFDGIVTAPIAKSAWQAAGHDYPGQTELLAERSHSPTVGMLFVARSPHTGWVLRTLLATTHMPLRQVADRLSPELLTAKFTLLIRCLAADFGISQPRIALCGLNPHAGEQGKLGREEIDWLIPWTRQMQSQFPAVTLEGPFPPDTLWVKPGQAWYGHASEGMAHDAYLALYHDQGLIPVKLMAFDRAVNTSIGLPLIRTSPDHGTAFDIAGVGIADATSMKAAVQLAIDLVMHKKAQVPSLSDPFCPS